jgi:hypothetical protein
MINVYYEASWFRRVLKDADFSSWIKLADD